jgi:hypothetical protein
MAFSEQQTHLAVTIDRHVNQVIASGGGDEALLASLHDHMGTFKQLLDTCSREDMDILCQRSCTSSLLIIPIARKPAKMSLFHHYVRGARHDTTPRLLSIGHHYPALVVHHATASLAEPTRWRAQAPNPIPQAQAQTPPRTQTLCGPDAKASLCPV